MDLCAEQGCDRPAEAGDRRCGLHRQRLGPLPALTSVPEDDPAPKPELEPGATASQFAVWAWSSAALTGLGVLTLAAMIVAEGDLVAARLEGLALALLGTCCLGAPAAAVVAVGRGRRAGRPAVAWLALAASLVPLAASAALFLAEARVDLPLSSGALQGFDGTAPAARTRRQLP
jgi:hypothetical protein